jgi:hypothetical protein
MRHALHPTNGCPVPLDPELLLKFQFAVLTGRCYFLVPAQESNTYLLCNGTININLSFRFAVCFPYGLNGQWAALGLQLPT